MRRKTYLLIIAILFAFYGCDSNMLESIADDSSDAADIEEATIALNDGDYDEAISLLEGKFDPASPDLEVGRILASAYMGKAGIDLTYIIENSDSGGDDSFDSIASALSVEVTSQAQAASFVQAKAESSTDPRFIVLLTMYDLLTNLENAQAILLALVDYYTGNNLTVQDDDVVQLGMASALHFIMKIGYCAGASRDYNAPVNKYAYQEVFPQAEDWTTLLSNLAAYIDSHSEIVLSLQEDLANVYAAVLVLITNNGADDDVADEFNDFMREILGLSDSASQAEILSEIDNFDGSMLADYIANELLEYN
jgi:hypothetical protein